MSLTESELDQKLADHAAKVKSITDNAMAVIVANSQRTEAKSVGWSGGYPLDDSSGQFIKGVFLAGQRDADEQAQGKSILDTLGAQYEESWGKATLGTSDASGGWIIPNAVVAEMTKAAAYQDPYRAICSDVTGITAFAVDLPFRSARPNRAVIAPFGSTKENVDLAYNGYTATMYTLARIHDLGNQFVRQSAGAAEQDVMQELGTAANLGTAYYTALGTGSSQPYGFITALQNSPGTFTTSHSPVATTLAGSVLRAIADAAGALASRGRKANAAVMASAAVWQMVSEGSDTAGTWFSGTEAPLRMQPDGSILTPFGIPIIGDDNPDFPADDLIVGDFRVLKRYFGQSFRIDSSNVAGERFDRNETGFRMELEFGLDARPAVFSGALQYVADIVP